MIRCTKVRAPLVAGAFLFVLVAQAGAGAIGPHRLVFMEDRLATDSDCDVVVAVIWRLGIQGEPDSFFLGLQIKSSPYLFSQPSQVDGLSG